MAKQNQKEERTPMTTAMIVRCTNCDLREYTPNKEGKKQVAPEKCPHCECADPKKFTVELDQPVYKNEPVKKR